MIYVTGGAGFIGSFLTRALLSENKGPVTVVDWLERDPLKWKNLSGVDLYDIMEPYEFLDQLEKDQIPLPEMIFHMGAQSSTTETDCDFLLKNNTRYSQQLFAICTAKKIPFVYASSAATYGDGSFGYSDEHADIPKLCPINPYGFSKQLFDLWVLKQTSTPPFWAGLRFFNVYGPYEYHKGDMKSLVCKAVGQIKFCKSLKLFKSYRENFEHGEQKRDFIYVKDTSSIMCYLAQNHKNLGSNGRSGIYNIGTGTARSFADLGRAVFAAMSAEPHFEWVEMPEAIRNQYQYFTKAEIAKLRQGLGFEKSFYSLEDGVKDYVQGYLLSRES